MLFSIMHAQGLRDFGFTGTVANGTTTHASEFDKALGCAGSTRRCGFRWRDRPDGGIRWNSEGTTGRASLDLGPAQGSARPGDGAGQSWQAARRAATSAVAGQRAIPKVIEIGENLYAYTSLR